MFGYDNQGRLTNVTNKDISGNVLASFDYGYDYDWGTSTPTMLGQRTSVTVASVPGTYLATGLTKYQYDSRYQLTRVDPPTDPYDTWTYDAIGNRTNSRYATYSYYKNGQNSLNGQRLRSVNGSPDYSYDATGNLTGYVTSPNMYTWDYVGRLTSAPGNSFTYDYLGRRTTSTSGNTTTRYVSCGQHTVGERNTTLGVSTDYVFGPGIDEPLAKRTADGAVSYYGADGLGSVVLVTDANATVTGSAAYDSWGTRGGGTELFGYTGRETGGSLWFYRARYYDSGTGRFLSEDSLSFQARFQTWDNTQTGQGGQPISPALLTEPIYSYALNDPVSHRDPFGMCSSCSSCAPTRDGPYPWQTPYGPTVASAYGNATGGPFNNNLNKVGKTFPNDPWSNCVRGCLLCDWDPCKKEYESGFYGAHAKCYAACALVWAAYNGPPPLLHTMGSL